MVLADERSQDIFKSCLYPLQRPDLIGSHESAVTDNVSSKDGG